MHRIVVAAIIVVVVGATIVAAAGSNGTEVATTGFRVAMPGAGSTAHYTAREILLSDDARPAMPSFTFSMEWGEPVMIMDAGYDHRAAMPLEIRYRFDDGETLVRQSLFDYATGEGIVSRTLYNATDGSTCMIGCIGATGGSTQDYIIDYYESGAVGPCGIMGPWYGRWLDVGDVIDVEADCHPPAEAGPVTFRVLGQDDIAGQDAFLLRGPRESDGLAYAPDVPFPLYFSSSFSHIMKPSLLQDRTWIATLESYEATAPYRPTTDSIVKAGPGTITGAPYGRQGLDEHGVTHPFPMSAAVAMLRDDPGGAYGAAAILDSPEGHIPEAWGFPTRDDNGRVGWVWNIVVSNGVDAEEYRVWQEAEQGILTGLTGSTLANVVSLGTPDDDYPPASAAPARVPTVVELMQRYDAFSRTDDVANRWGYSMVCKDPDCDDVDAYFLAGYAMIDVDETAVGATDQHLVSNLLEMRADGSPMLIYRVATWTPGWGLRPVGLEGGRDAQVPYDVKAQVPAWRPPSVAAAAGAGALALLAGVAYYLWPQTKALLLGFSRIRKDRVLEHPLREQIYQVVKARPGTHFQALQRDLGGGRGSLEHHLRRLVDAGIIVERDTHGYKCYFAKGAIDQRLMGAAGALKSDAARALLDAAAAHPGASSRTLAKHAGIASSTATHHFQRLRAAGLIENGGGLRVSPLGQQARALF